MHMHMHKQNGGACTLMSQKKYIMAIALPDKTVQCREIIDFLVLIAN